MFDSTLLDHARRVIDANRAEFGVEPIITTLASPEVTIAPSTYYAAKSRPPSARRQRDERLIPQLTALWRENYRVYGARKLWKAARRAGHDIGRDQVARLMRAAGIEGVRRGRQVRTTRPDPAAPRHPDLVKRDFTAKAPNQLWVTDLRTDVGRRRLRLLHRRRALQDDRRVASRGPYADRDGLGRNRNGPVEPRRPYRRAAVSQRRRLVNSPPSDTASGSPR